jgi:pyridoxal phosphate enzyme (YggS family)
MTIAQRYEAVMERVALAARRAGRSPSEVRVVAVSKTFPPDVLEQAIAAGVRTLGENRAQELKAKAAALGDRAEWHFVGPLQTNKVRHVVGVVALVHSVDRIGLAEAMSRRAGRLGTVQPVLIEVNVAGDPSKHGVAPYQAIPLAQEVAALDHLEVRGLMTMPPYPHSAAESRPFYKELAGLQELLVRSLPSARELSMGMSADFEVGIEQGATLVRVGEAIFGPRPA